MQSIGLLWADVVGKRMMAVCPIIGSGPPAEAKEANLFLNHNNGTGMHPAITR